MAFFHARPYLREDLIQDLSEGEDTIRIVQRFTLGRGQPSDLVAIKNTIQIWSRIKGRITLEKDMELKERGTVDEDAWSSIDALMRGMHDLDYLAGMIDQAIPGADDESGATLGIASADNAGNGGEVDHKSSSLLQATQGSVVVKHVIAPRSLSIVIAGFLSILTKRVVFRQNYLDCTITCRCCMSEEQHWNGDCRLNLVSLVHADLNPIETVAPLQMLLR